MTPKEKALEFYDKFQQYYWDENNVWIPDNKETKKLRIKTLCGNFAKPLLYEVPTY